ncbi:MAG: MATE family efflux transporter, partial [Treponema sp.]|nr:MATE family efflux transporter [Treponema sp.]
MSKKDFDISKLIQSGKTFSKRTLLSFVWKLSIPSILAQISSIIMQYIDSAMVGRIGAEAAASIGLVSPAMWLFGSICYSFVIGFSVQVAQAIGAGNKMRAKHLLCEGMIVCAILSVIVALVSFAISQKLPLWLGAEKSIHKNASEYFLIFQLGTPIFQTVYLMSMMLQSSGNMKTPAILNASMCGLDVIFNFIFIVVLKLGVLGAALGSVV